MLLLLIVQSLALPVAAYWRMECPGIVFEGRLDPVAARGKLAGHSHMVLGGNAFNAKMDYESTKKATCTSCTIKGDNSNYVSRYTPTLDTVDC
jgi:hypothetical protein